MKNTEVKKEMIENRNPAIDAEQLMGRIRSAVTQSRTEIKNVRDAAGRVTLSRMPESKDIIEIADCYAATDFLLYSDANFIRNAYRGILRREADSGGFHYYLSLLRNGSLSKLQILKQLRNSAEGIAQDVLIVGLYTSKLIDDPISPKSLQLERTIESKRQFTISDFLDFEDEDFIRNVYRGVVGREVDADGYANYLALLRSGALSKLEILGRVRYSSEGRTKNVSIGGLLPRFLLKSAFQIPIIGYLLSLASTLFRLPLLVKSLRRLEIRVGDQQREGRAQLRITQERVAKQFHLTEKSLVSAHGSLSALRHHIDKLAEQVEDVINIAEQHDLSQFKAIHTEMIRMHAEVLNLHEIIQDKADRDYVTELMGQLSEVLAQKAGLSRVDAVVEQFKAEVEELLRHKADENQVAELAGRISDGVIQKADIADLQNQLNDANRKIYDNKRNILDQHRRLTLLLEEARKRLPEPISQQQIRNMVSEEDHLLDAFYVSFEDRFRGTREDIKQRMKVYLPIVGGANVGTKDFPILDIGCGRGEWLELLKENEFVARGVDLNRIMVSQCQEIGLEVVEADVIAYMRSLKANSVGAVTGMHIIEHISFKWLIALFDEVLRVLMPGGLAIFETPNPENLIVGACSFYYDPTHLHPLPPEPTRFVMEARGFSRIEIMRLHPLPEFSQLREESEQLQQLVNGLLFGARDYSLVAYKD